MNQIHSDSYEVHHTSLATHKQQHNVVIHLSSIIFGQHLVILQCPVALRWQRLQQISSNNVITSEPRARTTSIIHATASKPGKVCLLQQMLVNKSRPSQVSNIIA